MNRTFSASLTLLLVLAPFSLLTGCKVCPCIKQPEHMREHMVVSTIQTKSISTRHPVLIHHVHPPQSPADEYFALIARDSEVDDSSEDANELLNFTIDEDGKLYLGQDESAHSFVYLSGKRPGVNTDNTDISSESTIVLVHIMPRLQRIYALKFHDDAEQKSVTIKSRRGITKTETILKPLQYVDVVTTREGVQAMSEARCIPDADNDPENIRAIVLFATEIAKKYKLDTVCLD